MSLNLFSRPPRRLPRDTRELRRSAHWLVNEGQREIDPVSFATVATGLSLASAVGMRAYGIRPTPSMVGGAVAGALLALASVGVLAAYRRY